jgi:hypothetical protein
MDAKQVLDEGDWSSRLRVSRRFGVRAMIGAPNPW